MKTIEHQRLSDKKVKLFKRSGLWLIIWKSENWGENIQMDAPEDVEFIASTTELPLPRKASTSAVLVGEAMDG